MSAPVEAPKTVDQTEVVGTTEAAPAPVLAADNTVAPVAEPKTEEAPKEEPVAAAEETKADEAIKEEPKEEKVVEPIYSGALGYKAPGLKNAFRFAKKFFWFGEEPVAAESLGEYLRGEKPEVAHPTVAWSSQTGKGLLFFVKHADKKDQPAGVLNLAYATDLAKDGALAFAFKLSGHKHAFEASTTAERDGWFVAVEKAITEAKASKDTIESSEGYKEAKEKIGKPTALAGATAAPKKSMDVAPKLAEGEASEPAAAPARTGSSSSSSSDDAKAKKAKSKSRSVSRGKRASLLGGLLGKKDKEPKTESEAVKEEPETKAEEPAATAPHLDEIPTTAPVDANDVVKPAETTAEPAAPVAAVPIEEAPKAEEPAVAAAAAPEKPKPTKRASIFGTFVEKLKSPTTEKREAEAGLAATPVKENETVAEPVKPVEETAPVAAPSANEAAAAELNKDETKPVVATSTPSKEKEHFSFGKLFGNKDRAKSPAAQEKLPEPKADAAPQIEDASAPAATEAVEATPATTEAKPETTEEPKQDKRKSFFGNLGRSLSKATGNKSQANKEKKEAAAAPAPVVEEETAPAAVPVAEEKKEEEAAAPVAPVAEVPAENSVGDASKSANPTVATTAPSTSPRASHISHGNHALPSSSSSPPPVQAIERPNIPLKPIQPFQRSRLPNTLAAAAATTKPSSRVKPLTDPTALKWTRARLEKERQDWWDTQVTGSPEIWGAIRLAAQHLQAGELQEAQTMLDVTGCTCPSGLVWRGVFDATGVQYKVPEWVVVEPEGVVEEDDDEEEGVGAEVEEEEGGDEEVNVRVRMSHDSKDVTVRVHRKESVAKIIEKIKDEAKLDPFARIRLAYGGRVYHEHESLEAHPHWNFDNQFVISGFVFL
ncbi:hypothetical protein COCVIDRAFT_27697 [Bipolaris victoriae FI3]|uniref:Ubiquitin-like domain-containing protein n=1 Tax=Bipolaris victoriae (strain FI3) TaxID=930091 RepID=W7EC80_BIPV3|nr:hypothetical protein COCVIDRAFT_27697 [Bipolaris victoriae FI3]